jgi:hypothetical protein
MFVNVPNVVFEPQSLQPISAGVHLSSTRASTRQTDGMPDPDDQLTVVATSRGPWWRICSRGVCIVDPIGARLLERYRALLVSQGRPVPPA